MCGNFFFCNSKPLLISHPYIVEGRILNAMFPADPVPTPRPALLAFLLACPAEVHAEMAAVSAGTERRGIDSSSPQFGDCSHSICRDG
jgi:hypothetical protein